jgi:hypothetical protein
MYSNDISELKQKVFLFKTQLIGGFVIHTIRIQLIN